MHKITFLILIWLMSHSLSFSQKKELGGGIIIGPFSNENFGFNFAFAHSLDQSKYLQTEFNVVSVTYSTNNLKHSSGIYSIEENLIISNDRENSSVFAYVGFGVGYYIITEPDYLGNWHENTYSQLSLSNAFGVNLKLGVRLAFLDFGLKNVLMFPYAKGVLNEHFLPDKSTRISKFITINLVRFYLGLTFSI